MRSEPELYSLEGDHWTLVKTGILSKADIKNDDCMCINVGTEIYITIGENAPEEERRTCMVQADVFLQQHNLARNTAVTRVMVPGGRAAIEDIGYLACFGENAPAVSGWIAKRSTPRPLYKRFWAELIGTVITFYDDETKTSSAAGGVLELAECTSVQSSVAPGVGAEEIEIVGASRTVRCRCDSSDEVMTWCRTMNQAMEAN
eukprot:SAG11_NODE_63_length_18904_cov_11.842914_15_plen_203_part_00